MGKGKPQRVVNDVDFPRVSGDFSPNKFHQTMVTISKEPKTALAKCVCAYVCVIPSIAVSKSCLKLSSSSPQKEIFHFLTNDSQKRYAV